MRSRACNTEHCTTKNILQIMKKITISTKKYYSTLTGEILELYMVELDGIEVDSFTKVEDAQKYAKGVAMGLKICGNRITIENTVPIKIEI